MENVNTFENLNMESFNVMIRFLGSCYIVKHLPSKNLPKYMKKTKTFLKGKYLLNINMEICKTKLTT